MCRDRGYLVTPEELNTTLEEFKEIYGDKPSQGQPSRGQLLMFVSHEEDPTDKMIVFFPEDNKVAVKTIKAFVNRMQQEEVYRAIIVIQSGGMSPSAKQVGGCHVLQCSSCRLSLKNRRLKYLGSFFFWDSLYFRHFAMPDSLF